MTRKVRLLRIFWPALLFAAGVVAYASHEEAVAALGLNLDLGVVRLVTGGVCYFAAAWLGSRLGGFAIMAKDRKSVVQGQSVSVRVDHERSGIIKKNKER